MFPKTQAFAGLIGFFRDAPKMRVLPFAALLALSLAFVVGVRLQQVRFWEENRESHFADDIPMMTTVDAYYWLRWAREYAAGGFEYGENDPLRNYPDGKERGSPLKPHTVMLSKLIAWVANLAGINVYVAGLYLVPFLSALFVIPLALYMYRIGFPIAGLLGGVLAGVSFEYYIRTSVGRVDTDCLNLFFMFLIPYFILMTEKRGDFGVIVFASLAGFACFLFNWWYSIASFVSVFFVLLLVKLALNRTPASTMAVAAFFFAVFCEPETFFKAAAALEILFRRLFPAEIAQLTSSAATGGTGAPDAMQTITELERFGVEKTLGLVLDGPRFVAAGLILFALMLAANPDRILPLTPVLALGLLAFLKGRRFAMYLAPFAGIGWGYGLTLAVSFFARLTRKRPSQKRKKKMDVTPAEKPRPWIHESLLALAALAVFWLVLPATAVSHIPGAKIDAKIYSGLVKLKGLLPEGARVFNYWNFGYLITDTVGRATYNDGGMPGSTKTYFMSHAYSATSPRELYNIASFLDRRGDQGLTEVSERHPDFANAVRAVAGDATAPPDGIHIAFTGNMLDQFPSINFLGAWDFEKNAGDQRGYNVLECGGSNQGILKCKEGTFDMNKGTLNGQPLLAMTIAVEKGREKQRIPVRDQGYVLELLLEEGRISKVILLTSRGYLSNFNQMFILGRYDGSLFEPIYDAFPALRVYRMKRVPPVS